MRLRTRLTLLYGGLFALVSSVLLVVVEQLQLSVFNQAGDAPYPGPVDGPVTAPPPSPDDIRQTILRTQKEVADQQHHLTLIGIVVVTVLAFVVCWWLTGRLLRPLQRINSTARRLSISNLHERIGLTGRPDELKELADTFDAMLDRLEEAVASQRRFVANASHELRTPLAIQRTAIEVGLDDPSPERLARIRAEMLRNTERSERLIEGLLVLAQGERGLRHLAPVALDEVVEQVVTDHRGTVRLVRTVEPVMVIGDEVLLARLVANLVENAIRYNRPDGTVTITLTRAALVVVNTGAPVRPDRVPELFEPFRRLHPDRTGAAGGAGLGLSIVAAIAHAHGATVQATANPGGGLTVTVAFTSPAPRSG
jgi:signal transduction histidine kinase